LEKFDAATPGDNVDRIRVLFANTQDEKSRKLREILRAQGDIELVEKKPELLQTLIAVGEANADVVLVDAPETGEVSPMIDHLLMEYPSVVIIALGADRVQSQIYRFRIECTPLDDGTAAAVVDAIRGAHYGSLH
jgi:chemotaxis response regulator CheB